MPAHPHSRITLIDPTFPHRPRTKAALLVAGHNSDHGSLRKLKEAFAEIDTHKTGYISIDELSGAFAHGKEPDEAALAQAKSCFKALDQDGTGRISYAEFLAATIESHEMLSEEQLADSFDRLDADDSGFITAKNLESILGEQFSKEIAESMIQDGDFKNDRKISYDEFVVLMKKGAVEGRKTWGLGG